MEQYKAKADESGKGLKTAKSRLADIMSDNLDLKDQVLFRI